MHSCEKKNKRGMHTEYALSEPYRNTNLLKILTAS